MSKLLTIKELAPILNIAEITIRRLIKRNSIPFHKIGSHYFFTEDDVQIFLSKSAVPIKEVDNDNTK